MTVTDIITDETRPLTQEELDDRRDLHRWRFRVIAFYVVMLVSYVLVFAGGYWVRESGWLQ